MASRKMVYLGYTKKEMFGKDEEKDAVYLNPQLQDKIVFEENDQLVVLEEIDRNMHA